jgi:hypothetical protein
MGVPSRRLSQFYLAYIACFEVIPGCIPDCIIVRYRHNANPFSCTSRPICLDEKKAQLPSIPHFIFVRFDSRIQSKAAQGGIWSQNIGPRLSLDNVGIYGYVYGDGHIVDQG